MKRLDSHKLQQAAKQHDGKDRQRRHAHRQDGEFNLKKKHRKKSCHRQFFVSQFVTVLSTVTLSRIGEPMGAKVKRVQVSLVKQYK